MYQKSVELFTPMLSDFLNVILRRSRRL